MWARKYKEEHRDLVNERKRMYRLEKKERKKELETERELIPIRTAREQKQWYRQKIREENKKKEDKRKKIQNVTNRLYW